MKENGNHMNHVKVRYKTAIIEFEDSIENQHEEIIEELVHLVEHDFKSYIFDFTWMNDTLSSTVVGFIIASIKKLLENEAHVNIRNITEHDLDTLKLVGVVDFSDKNKNLTILIRED